MKHLLQASFVGVGIFAAVQSCPAALFNTSFETDEGYSTANLIGQDSGGWTAGFGTVTGMSVITAADDSLTAPHGSNVAKVLRGAGSTRASHKLDAAGATLTTPFSLTVFMAYDEVGTNGSSALTVLNNLSDKHDGVQFGFNKSGTDTYIQYRNGETWTNLPGQSGPALERTFYKFVVNVRPDAVTAQFDLSVYEMDGDLVGSVTNATARQGLRNYTYLNITLLDDQNDLMWFDMAPVPEPSAGLVPAALGTLMLVRRRRR